MSQIESTYKALEVEETIDIYFYRPIGYLIAKFCQAVHITPNVVTVSSIIIGLVGGHLFYYQDLTLNLIGMTLFLFADILDSTDGQLARMMNIYSRFGRILDGVGGNLMFGNIYLHFCARTIHAGGSPFVLLLAVIAGTSHSIQSGLADYYRNAYIRFVVNPSKGELDSLKKLRKDYQQFEWKKDFLKKLGLRFYINYTAEQEAFSRNFQALRAKVEEVYGKAISPSFSQEYQRLNKPLMKYYTLLSTNIRLIVMFTAILIDRVTLYFWFEVLLLNLVMILLTAVQEGRSKELIQWIEA